MNLTEIQLMKTMAAHPRNMHIILFILFIYLFYIILNMSGISCTLKPR